MIRKQTFIYIYCFLLGLFGFSVFGLYILINITNLPFYFVEIFFVPMVLFNISSISSLLTKIRISMLFLVVLLIMSMLSNIIYTGQVFLSLIAYRSIIYLLIAYSYTKKYKLFIHIRFIYITAIGTIVGETLYVFLFNTGAITSSVNYLAFAIAIWIPFLMKKYFVAGLSLAGTLIVAIHSGFRIGIIVVIFTLINMFFYSILNNSRQRKIQLIRTILFYLIGFLGITYFIRNLNDIVEFIANKTSMNSFAIFRVTSRLNDLFMFNFAASQDTLRLNLLSAFYEKIWNVIPGGLVGMVEGGIKYAYYIDLPPIYLIDIFGSFATLIIIIHFIIRFIIKIKLNRFDNQLEELAVWLLPLLGLLFLSNGTIIVNTGQAIMTGMILGKATSNTNKS